MSATSSLHQSRGRRLRVAPVVACAVLSLWSAAAFAWGARVHTLIGDIATQYLAPQSTLVVGELLRDDLGADGKPSGRATLGQVASWPDELRANAGDRGTYFYHYDDIPVCGAPDRAKYCANGQCATAWLDRQLAILKDKSQPPRARNEALKWVVHLIADLHQPLHASNDDDKGGNDVKITWFGRRGDAVAFQGREPRPYNLHTAWDRLIPDRMLDERGGDARFLADQPDEVTRKQWEQGDVAAWTMESFAVARDFVYPTLPVAFACGQPITAVVALDEAYYRPAADIAAERIRKAGVRLARVLNVTFAEP